MKFAPVGVDHFEKIFWINPQNYKIMEHRPNPENNEVKTDTHRNTLEKFHTRFGKIIN